MAFPDLQKRLDLWKTILVGAEARLANVATDYPAADAALKAKIQSNETDSVRTARGYVAFYEAEIARK